MPTTHLPSAQIVQLIELALVLAFSAQVFLRPRPAPFFSGVKRHLANLARRKRLCVLIVGSSVLVVRVALMPLLGVPEPRWHDEFSYLVAADTFAHGRLTNPPHAMWIHFETFHVIEHPTYMSMYPPAQGLVLGLGERMGHAWIGQLLITALMCSGLCWMLQGWLPPQWALLGAGLAALRLGILSYWMNGYWAASVVALAGSLVLGSFPRIQHRGRVRDAVWMALGLSILANSRPYEGLLLAVTVGAALVRWLFSRNRPALSIVLVRVGVPILSLLIVGAVVTGYYYQRVTGSAFRTGYQLNRATYSQAPYFIWQNARPEPIYHHEVIRAFYQREFRDYQDSRRFTGFLRNTGSKAWFLWIFYLGPLLTLPLLALPWAIQDRRLRFPLFAGTVLLFGITVEVWASPHYLAAATGLLYLIIVQSIRHLRFWRWHGNEVGLGLVHAIPVVAGAMILVRILAIAAHTPLDPPWPRGNLSRAEIMRRLENMPGGHLIVVDYSPSHDLDSEWVYNRADIDHAKVVWARDMGASDNRELFGYFSDRSAWILNADDPEPRPVPYSGSPPSKSSDVHPANSNRVR
jgi:hypothetical protein